MNRNILLVFPEIPTVYWSLQGALEFVGKESFMPPLGLIDCHKRTDEIIEYYKKELTSQKGVSSYKKNQSSMDI